MAIQTSIEIADRITAPLLNICNALNQTVAQFEEVNQASNNAIDPEVFNSIRGQIQVANSSYEELTDEIQKAAREQDNLNQSIKIGASNSNDLLSTVKRIGGAYLGFQGVKKTLDISDELTQTQSRIDIMNQSFINADKSAASTEQTMQMIYQAAQNARGSFGDMASVVARFGNNAGDAFGSTQEVIKFAETVQKQMTIAGASGAEASNAMLQLSQALGSGTLRGDELNSIFEQAPNLIQSIANYMDVPIGQIRQMASEGQLTADVVKNAIMASADDIDAQFGQMKMTWGQVWQSVQNTALMSFQPVLDKINQIANTPQFQQMVTNFTNGFATMAYYLGNLIDLTVAVAGFFVENWSVIEPIIMGIVAALALYEAYMLIGNAVTAAGAVITAIHTAFTSGWTIATFAQTVAQQGLNAALLACPITWIVIAVIALLAVIIAICQGIANATGVASSWFGVMMGGVFVVGAAFKNFGLLVANIALGIWNALGAVCENIGIAFHNVIANVQSWFYGLLATALEVVEGICEALNKLPFVEFDFSSISSAADDYAAKSAEAAGSVQEYTSVGDAFSEGMSTFEYADYGEAFANGAAWGDGIADSVAGALDFSSSAYGSDLPLGDMGSDLGSIADSSAQTAANTSNDVDVTDEQLQYLRDIAETEAINRFTTAEISVNMTNNNNVSSDMDIDGIVTTLSDGVYEAMLAAAEGV